MLAKMSSLQEQPGPSPQAQELGEAVQTLQVLLAKDANDDDVAELAVIDRVGGDVQR